MYSTIISIVIFCFFFISVTQADLVTVTAVDQVYVTAGPQLTAVDQQNVAGQQQLTAVDQDVVLGQQLSTIAPGSWPITSSAGNNAQIYSNLVGYDNVAEVDTTITRTSTIYVTRTFY